VGTSSIAIAGKGCLKLYAAPAGGSPADEELQRHRARLLRELETLSFGVPARGGHADYLMSLAGCPRTGVAYAAATTPLPPVSSVITPEER